MSAVSLQTPLETVRGRLFGVQYATVGLIIVVDQLLLPMFHLGPIPVKISYLVLGLWALNHLLNPRDRSLDATDRRDFRRFAQAIAGIMVCALLGEIVFGLVHPVTSYAETIRSVLIYSLWVLAMGTGISSWTFKLHWLTWVFYASIALNLAFIVLRSRLPGWLVHFYYSSLDVGSLSALRVQSVEDIAELLRPRGLFLNPNVSMSLINVIVVFIYVAIRERLLPPPRTLVALGVILLPMLLAALLASRSEFIVSVVLAVANARVLLRNMERTRRFRLIAVAVVTGIASTVQISSLAEDTSLTNNLDRITTVLAIADKATDDGVAARAEGVARPLLLVEVAQARFLFSPLFGSGFSSSDTYPFDYETQYFHNDWFRLAVTSGILGVLLMLWIIRAYCLPLGAIVVVPFVLPGLTNTFMLNIPAMIFYLFMVGVLRKTLRLRDTMHIAAA